MKHKTLSFILFLILIGGLFWYINKNYYNFNINNPSSTDNIINDLSDEGSLAFVDKSNYTSIYILENNTPKKIYTDVDESDKILKVGSVIDEYKLPIITNVNKDAEIGSLELLNLKTLKKELLKTDYHKPLIFDVSSNGHNVASVYYSNVEDKYGYNLYLDQSLIVNKSTYIQSVKFNYTANRIVITTTSGLDGEILVYNLKDKNLETLKSIPNCIIESISWTTDNQILFSSREIGTQKSKLSKLDVNRNIEEILTTDSGTINFIIANRDLSKIGYIIAQYDKIANDITKGQIFIYNINDKKKDAIGKGTQIIGWPKGV